MPSASAIPISLNGHPLRAVNGHANSAQSSSSSVAECLLPVASQASAHCRLPSASSPASSAPSAGSAVGSDSHPAQANPSVFSVLSVVNADLLCDLLAGEFLLPYIAARHNVPLSALNAWVESEEVQSLLESCRRITAWRARYLALDSIPRAIHGLITTMDQNPGTEKARRAATTIINLAFKKDLSAPPPPVSPDPGGGDVAVRRDREGQSGCAVPPALTRSDSRATSTPSGCDGIRSTSSSSGGVAALRASAPPPATNEQPYGLRDPAPEAPSLKTQACASSSPSSANSAVNAPSPSASWISSARFTAADILNAVGAPRSIERPRSRAPT